MNVVHVSPISTMCCTAANPDPRPAYQELSWFVFILVLVCTLRYQTFHTSLVVPYSSGYVPRPTYVRLARDIGESTAPRVDTTSVAAPHLKWPMTIPASLKIIVTGL